MANKSYEISWCIWAAAAFFLAVGSTWAAERADVGDSLFLDPERIFTSITPPLTQREFEHLYLTWPADLRERAERDEVFKWKTFFDRYGFWENPYFKRKSEAKEWQDFFSSYGKTPSPLDPAPHRIEKLRWIDPPMGFKIDAKAQWHWDCLTCHAGPVPGYRDGRVTQTIQLGAPNIHLDLASYLTDRMTLNHSGVLRDRAGLGAGYYFGFYFGGSSLNVPALQIEPRVTEGFYMEFFKRFQESFPGTYSRGTLTPWPAVAAALELGDGEIHQSPFQFLEALPKVLLKNRLTFYGTQSADLDVPAWWTTAWKDHLYVDGFAPKNPWLTHIGALKLGRKGLLELQASGDAQRMVDSFKQIPAPRWPDTELPKVWQVKPGLAERGKALFEKSCAHCHGTYEKSPIGETIVRYPNLRQVPIREIESDPLRLEKGMTPELRSAIKASIFGVEAEKIATDAYGRIDEDPIGYTPPPLVGIWASRPYLHNGSVPTLEDLLKPEDLRPKIWEASRLDQDGRTLYDYDFVKVGFAYRTATAEALDSVQDPERKRRFFDTRKPGKSNSGHGKVFARLLGDYSSAEGRANRMAILEYLKTL